MPQDKRRDGLYRPTLTDVLPSSSDARLPPPALLVMLMRLFARGGRIIPLMGREPTPGEPGGELAMALQVLLRRQNVVVFRETGVAGSCVCAAKAIARSVWRDAAVDRGDERLFVDAARRIAREHETNGCLPRSPLRSVVLFIIRGEPGAGSGTRRLR